MSAVRCPLTMKTTTFSIKDLRKHFRMLYANYMPIFWLGKGKHFPLTVNTH